MKLPRFQWSLFSQLIFLSVLALLCWPCVFLRQAVLQEERVAVRLGQLDCRLHYDSDGRRGYWLLPVFVQKCCAGEGAERIVEQVNLSKRIRSAEETEQIVQLVRELHHVRDVDFTLAEPSPADIRALSHLRELRYLNLGHVRNELTDEHCRAIAELQSLSSVSVRLGKISDEGLALLKAMPQIKLTVVYSLPGKPNYFSAHNGRGGYRYDIGSAGDPPLKGRIAGDISRNSTGEDSLTLQ